MNPVQPCNVARNKMDMWTDIWLGGIMLSAQVHKPQAITFTEVSPSCLHALQKLHLNKDPEDRCTATPEVPLFCIFLSYVFFRWPPSCYFRLGCCREAMNYSHFDSIRFICWSDVSLCSKFNWLCKVSEGLTSRIRVSPHWPIPECTTKCGTPSGCELPFALFLQDGLWWQKVLQNSRSLEPLILVNNYFLV